jgi:hypothetical protein
MIKTSVLFVFSAMAFCLSISAQTTETYKVNTNGVKEKADTTVKRYSGGTDQHNINTNGVKEKTDKTENNNNGDSDSYKVNSNGAKEKVSTTKKINKRNMYIDPVPPHYGAKKLKRMQKRYDRKLHKTFDTISKK